MLIGKDDTEWKKNPPRNFRQANRNNIIRFTSGVTGNAKEAITPLEAFQLFFPDDMLSKIVSYTNTYIQQNKSNISRERDALPTNIMELKALIGLLFMGGVLRSSHLNTEDLWSKDGTGVEIFPCVMSRNRFKFLLQCIRFDDIETRETRKKIDRLAPIREIFEYFNAKCQQQYVVGDVVTIDEMLESFRGRCGFRQYIKSKPAKYGIKIFAVVDSKMFYTHNMEIYAGKQPEGPFNLCNSPASLVKRLVTPIMNTGRNVTMDNWFTSVPLFQDLFNNYGLTAVGTMRKNKREVPTQFITKREEYSSLFGFGEANATLVSYVPKKGRIVLLLSNFHQGNTIDESSGSKKKPEIITYYNQTKAGVDVVDEMKATYSVSRTCCRWPLRIFYSLLDIAGINSQIILHENSSIRQRRRLFLKSLALQLVDEMLKYRLTLAHLPRGLKTSISKFVTVRNEVQPENEEPARVGRCSYCPRKNDKKTNKKCCKCSNRACNEHMKLVCDKCYE